jgi:hypothetical protein
MSRVDAIIWEAGLGWFAALAQIGGRDLRLARVSEFAEFRATAVQCPYAVSLWEVNLSNWETRAKQLAEFARRQPEACIAMAPDELPAGVIELFREFGATMILRDRLESALFLRWATRHRRLHPDVASQWRDIVQTSIPWLDSSSLEH